MGKRQPERLRNDLARRRGAQKLAATAGRTAGFAAKLRRLLKSNHAMGITSAKALHLARILGVGGRQRHSPRHQHARQLARTSEGHHHCGQPLVAGGHPDDACPRRQRADQAAEDDGGIVAIGQAVHHPARALCPAIAGIGASAREWNATKRLELCRCCPHQ
jgi:hypothetical protein